VPFDDGTRLYFATRYAHTEHARVLRNAAFARARVAGICAPTCQHATADTSQNFPGAGFVSRHLRLRWFDVTA